MGNHFCVVHTSLFRIPQGLDYLIDCRHALRFNQSPYGFLIGQCHSKMKRKNIHSHNIHDAPLHHQKLTRRREGLREIVWLRSGRADTQKFLPT
jgi:hypothetical protein